ncbi:Protein of unknown function [Gryllus bimaculatus]|nr:Protein of unknown function [Gryllus bimaculatus]
MDVDESAGCAQRVVRSALAQRSAEGQLGEAKREDDASSSSTYSSSEDFYLESMEETTLVKDRFFEEADDEGLHDSSFDLDYSAVTTRHRNTIVDLAMETRE